MSRFDQENDVTIKSFPGGPETPQKHTLKKKVASIKSPSQTKRVELQQKQGQDDLRQVRRGPEPGLDAEARDLKHSD